MSRWVLVAAAGLALLLAPGAAQALTVVSAQVDSGRACVDQACAVQTLMWSSSSGTATGTFDIAGSNLTFSVTLPSSTFVPISGASDNGVTQLAFSNTTYSGSASVTDLGSGFSTFTGIASISGTQTPSGAGAAGLFSVNGVDVSGSCIDDGSSVACALVFGAANFGIDVNGQTRYFTHTIDLVGTAAAAVPEPSAAVMFGLGLLIAGSSVRQRRAIAA